MPSTARKKNRRLHLPMTAAAAAADQDRAEIQDRMTVIRAMVEGTSQTTVTTLLKTRAIRRALNRQDSTDFAWDYTAKRSKSMQPAYRSSTRMGSRKISAMACLS